MKSVIIAEKPSVAKDIASALGGFTKNQTWYESDTAIITNGFGHLVECFSEEMESIGANRLTGLPVLTEKFKLRPRDKASAQLSLLKKLMDRKDVDTIINACDAGREGELIFRLIVAACGIRKPIKRMWYTSMTKNSLCAAFNNLADGGVYRNLYDAAQCRNESDYLIGLNASKGISDCLSILARQKVYMRSGRVQTPVTAMIVDRENEILNFVPKDFNEITGTFKVQDGTYQARLKIASETAGEETTRIFDKSQLNDLLLKLKSGHVEKASDETKKVVTKSPALFSLSALQKEASKRFKFTLQQTLDLTQSLYEKHKMVTYPRTSSDALPEDYVSTVIDILNRTLTAEPYKSFIPVALSGDKIVQANKAVFDNERISDHFAIVPAVGSQCDISGLTENEHRIYDLIVRRFISVFYPDAIFNETIRTTVVSGLSLVVKGRVQVQQGWQSIMGVRPADNVLCALGSGEIPSVVDMDSSAGKTTPPKRYDDASVLTAMINAGRLVDDKSLAQAMKATGLGTEATRAGIIEGLLRSKSATGKPIEPYIIRDKSGCFAPTELAFKLVNFCRASGLELLTSPELTGHWEHNLALVEKGQMSRTDFMTQIREQASMMIAALKTQVSGVNESEALTFENASCPKCSSVLNEFYDHIGCKNNCGFRIHKNMYGRKFTNNEIRSIINDRHSVIFDDFTSSKSKSNYSARIVLKEDFKAEIEFKKPDSVASQFSCPKCKKSLMKVMGNYPALACEPCAFSLSTIIARRTMNDDELNTLLTTGYLNSRNGFVSSKNKGFSAALSLDNKTGKVTFSFDN